MTLRAWRRSATGLIFSALAVAGLAIFAAQRPVSGPIKGFKIPDYYPTPTGGAAQLRSLLSGAQAYMQSDSRIPIEGLRLDMYSAQGQTNLVIEAKDCVYERQSKTASSGGPLQVTSGDGRVAISGQGFRWYQTNGNLAISNQVQTLIQQKPPIRIQSRQLWYEAETNRASYLGGVVATDGQFEMTSEFLRVNLPSGGKLLERAQASTNVTVNSPDEGLHATAMQADYHSGESGQFVNLTGSPAWRHGDQSGKADALRLDRKRRVFLAWGNTYTRLPRQQLSQPNWSFVSTVTNNPSPLAASQFVEVYADDAHAATNEAFFLGRVKVVENGANGPATTTAGMLAYFPLNATEKALVLDSNVVLQQGENQIRGERLVHFPARDAALVTGHPSWQASGYQGQADQLVLRPQLKQMLAFGHARMHMPLTASNAPLTLASDPANAPAKPGLLKISCAEYSLGNGLASFTNNVLVEQYVDGQRQARLVCQKLTATLNPRDNRIDRLVAEQAVVFEQGIPGVTNGPATYQKLLCQKLTVQTVNGQMQTLVAERDVLFVKGEVQVTSQRMTYEAATDQFRFEDNPMILTAQGKIGGPVVVYDRKQDKGFVLGGYKWSYKLPPMTNAPQTKTVQPGTSRPAKTGRNQKSL